MRISPRTGLGLAATAILLAVGWWLLGPSQLGGPTSYAVLSGNSMEPRLEGGDLVVARAKPSYHVGEVVLYEDRETGARVLHRVIGERGGRFVTKGDNNDFVDPVRPARDEVVGELWFAVPGAGTVLAWLKQPLHLGLLLALLVLVGLGGRRELPRSRPPGVRPLVALPGAPAAPVPAIVGTVGRAFATVGAVTLAIFVALGVAAHAASGTSIRPIDELYAHEGRFSYSATTEPDPVYPSGAVETGMPVFTRLVDTLLVAFAYRFDTRQPADVHGSTRLDAVVRDTTGWQRILPISPAHSFDGTVARAEGLFDVSAFEELVLQARELTAAPLAGITVELRPHVDVSGTAGATRVDESFAPSLVLSYDGTTLRPLPAVGAPPGAAAPFAARRVEPGTEIVPAALGVGSLSLTVDQARTLGWLGVAASLAVLLVGGALLVAGTDGAPASRIAMRHGSRIVQARAVIPDERWVTEVDDIDALARIADAYGRVILHVTENGDDVYLVDDGIAVYRYRDGRVPRPTDPLPSASW